MNAVIMPRPEDSFNWLAPDYGPIWKARLRRLAKLRSDPAYLQACRVYYPTHIADFIQDWGVTVDPRNAKPANPGAPRKPVLMPMVLFPKQRQFLEWLVLRWSLADVGDGDGVLVKSRDCGASWMAMAFSVSLCLFYNDLTIGFGSAVKAKVDNAGDPDSLFYKGRKFIEYLPREFKGQWDERKCSADMRLVFPDSNGAITGECGDKIGRGGRKTMYFVDEFAFVERPKLVDRNLVANTDCRIEMSSVQGTANVFAERARGGLIPRFDFEYWDDPRKTYVDEKGVRQLQAWFAAKKAKMDPVAWAQEYERDFLASVEGIIIPQEWVEAAVDAHIKLNIAIVGPRTGSFDVADQGKDLCAYASGQGILLDFIESWRGKGSDIFKSVERVFRLADGFSETQGNKPTDEQFCYDADGMGAGVRGDAQKVNDEREQSNKDKGTTLKIYPVNPFWGSGEVQDKLDPVPGTEGDRKNEDFFENFKAQAWWGLRWKFLQTYRAVTGQITDYNADDLISLSSKLPELSRLKSELSQPVWKWSKTGKMIIDKAPDDVASPNHADAVMMRFGYRVAVWTFPDELFNLI